MKFEQYLPLEKLKQNSMDLKFTVTKTFKSNTFENGKLDGIVRDEYQPIQQDQAIRDKILRRWMNEIDEHSDLLHPLTLHTVKCIKLDVVAVAHTVSHDYEITFEMSSFWLEYLNSFPNNEYLLIDKEENTLLNFTAPKDCVITRLID